MRTMLQYRYLVSKSLMVPVFLVANAMMLAVSVFINIENGDTIKMILNSTEVTNKTNSIIIEKVLNLDLRVLKLELKMREFELEQEKKKEKDELKG